MFEAAEAGSKISRDEADELLLQLRVDLINAQYDLREADFPVLIVLMGDDRPGVSGLVNRLNEWMDGRYIRTHVFGAPTDEELQRPRDWRYWLALPAHGQLAIYTGAFALETILERLQGAIDRPELDRRLRHMRRLEQSLRDDGALVLKFWIHLPRKTFKKRIKQSRKKGGGRLDATDHLIFDAYDDLMPLAEYVLRKTDPGGAPWHIVEGTQARYRDITVARIIRSALTERLSRPPAPAAAASAPPAPTVAPEATVLDAVDLDATLTRPEYRATRNALQARLRMLTRRAREAGISSVVVFEGWDAAGKGGVIRRITQAMDVQDYRVVPIGAPTDEELAHHYLWRFWRQLPRAGRMVIFDRSWYGRVLVERVEGLVPEIAWQRAYTEIDDFEEQIAERGIPLFKFWLHMDREEQIRRFRARERTPYKKYKITNEDYRNRERWGAYRTAVNDMVQRTSTQFAPWTLVPANDKRFARVKVLRTICTGLAKGLDEG